MANYGGMHGKEYGNDLKSMPSSTDTGAWCIA